MQTIFDTLDTTMTNNPTVMALAIIALIAFVAYTYGQGR